MELHKGALACKNQSTGKIHRTPDHSARDEFKMCSTVMLRHWKHFDIVVPGAKPLGPCQLGFRKTGQCAELVAVLRSTTENATDWAEPLYVCQLDCSHSIRHVAKKTGTPREASQRQ